MPATGTGEPPWRRLAAALSASEACDDTTSLVRSVADACLTLLTADAVSISRVEPERRLLRTLVNAGVLAAGEETLPGHETYALADLPFLDGLVTDARAWHLSVDDVDADPGEVALLRRCGRYAALAVPILRDGRVWGEIYAGRVAPPAFCERDRALLEVVGAHLGSVLALLARSERRAANAQVDPLTGLHRRDEAERVVAGCREGVVVAAVDLDGLKRVNDEFGHSAGDRVLVTVADALTAATEHLPGRVVCRVGGDEFVVVVPGLDIEAVHTACVAARSRLVSALPDAGLSCGIACSTDLTGGLGSGRPLFRLADATLYRAKRSRAQAPLRAWEARGVRYAPSLHTAARENEVPTWPDYLARLRTPVDVFARSVDAAAWWVSHAPAGTGRLITRDRLILRDNRQETGADMSLIGAEYELQHLPTTRDALQHRSFHVGINDVDSHPSEQLFLAELGYTSSLMAGATDRDGDGWLVEIDCDPATARLDTMGSTLLRLIDQALRTPPP